jgi:hypothetical protein
MDWRDALSVEVRGLEAGAEPLGGHNPELAGKARAMLAVLRGYEVRLRRLVLGNERPAARLVDGPPW